MHTCRLENAEVRVGSWPITTGSQSSELANNPLCWKLAGKGVTNAVYEYACNGGVPLTGQYVTVQNFQNATICMPASSCALQVGATSHACTCPTPSSTAGTFGGPALVDRPRRGSRAAR